MCFVGIRIGAPSFVVEVMSEQRKRNAAPTVGACLQTLKELQQSSTVLATRKHEVKLLRPVGEFRN
jgi:hypothetical protein